MKIDKTSIAFGGNSDEKSREPRSDKDLIDGMQKILDGNGSLLIDKTGNPKVTSIREAIEVFLIDEGIE